MSTQVNTFRDSYDSDTDGYTAAEWSAEQSEADAAQIAAIEHPLCFTPRSLRPRRAGRAQSETTVSGRLPWHEPVRPADHLHDEQYVYREEARVHEHGRRPCHKVPDHRSSGETRWRTPQSLGLPWCGSEFVLVGPADAMVPGTHVTVTHKNASTSRAYVADLGPLTTCGGRVGYTR